MVEDEVLVGLDVDDALSEAGFAVRWVASPEGASTALATLQPDIVILDVVRRDEACALLARELKRRGIPFVVHSGCPRDAAPADLGGVPWLKKPADMSALLATVSATLRASPLPDRQRATEAFRP